MRPGRDEREKKMHQIEHIAQNHCWPAAKHGKVIVLWRRQKGRNVGANESGRKHCDEGIVGDKRKLCAEVNTEPNEHPNPNIGLIFQRSVHGDLVLVPGPGEGKALAPHVYSPPPC